MCRSKASTILLLCTALCVLALGSVPLHAANYFVSLCGQDIWTGLQPGCVGPHGPKRTIQAAINAASHGDTVFVMPGGYVEQINLHGKAITLISTLGPDVTIIDGGGSGPIVTMNSLEGPNTVINGFTIRNGHATSNGGAGMFIALASPTIHNCTFENNLASGDSSYGGGIRGIQSSATVSNCRFVSNSAMSGGGAHFRYGQPQIVDCIFENNGKTYIAAGLALIKTPGAIVTGSTFTGNIAQDSAGLYVHEGTVTVTNCTFTDNTSARRGAGLISWYMVSLSVSDCHFESNMVDDVFDGNGGGILIVSGPAVIANSTFVNNTTSGSGSAIHVTGSHHTALQGCSFTGNVSTSTAHSSSAVFFGGASGSVVGCNFTANTGNAGAAIGAWNASVSVTWSGFHNNTVTGAQARGAAIFADSGSSVSVGLSTFLGNTSQIRGGAIAVENSTLELQGCVLTSNTAQNGGAISIEDSQLNVLHCTFAENFALNSGGAIRSLHSDVTAEQCNFNGNIAQQFHGGAIYLSGGSLEMQINTFTWNVASQYGGAVEANQANVSAKSCAFENNSVTHPEHFSRGGGLRFSNAFDGTLELDDCVFAGNTAGYGGGFEGGGKNVVMNSCMFMSNTAFIEGGGARVHTSGSQGRLRDVRFISNSAGYSGGGAHFLGDGNYLVDSSEFIMNSAANGGAASMWNMGSPHDGRIVVSACRFNGNSATMRGSALDVQGGATLFMVNGLVYGNSAPAGGGTISESEIGLQQGRFQIVNSTIAYNNGGAVAISASDTESSLKNSIVWNNPGAAQFFGTLPQIRHSNVEGGAPGVGNISSNPAFVNPIAADFRLQPKSPCIDAGHNWALLSDAFDLNGNGITNELWPVDFDGNPRITDNPNVVSHGCGPTSAIVDMGAFETAGVVPAAPLIFADLNGDGVVDVMDLLILMNQWGECKSRCCIADLNLDGYVDVLDLLGLLAHWG